MWKVAYSLKRGTGNLHAGRTYVLGRALYFCALHRLQLIHHITLFVYINVSTIVFVLCTRWVGVPRRHVRVVGSRLGVQYVEGCLLPKKGYGNLHAGRTHVLGWAFPLGYTEGGIQKGGAFPNVPALGLLKVRDSADGRQRSDGHDDRNNKH